MIDLEVGKWVVVTGDSARVRHSFQSGTKVQIVGWELGVSAKHLLALVSTNPDTRYDGEMPEEVEGLLDDLWEGGETEFVSIHDLDDIPEDAAPEGFVDVSEYFVPGSISFGPADLGRTIQDDPVNHPTHYKTDNGLEAIDVMESFNLHRDGRLFNAGKYILRAGQKGLESQDIRKAVWYLERYADDLEDRGA